MNLTALSSMYEKMGGSYFAYDLDAMGKHLKSLRAVNVRLWYACKANPLSSILQEVNAAGLSFDVASIGELNQVLRQGIVGDRILLTGPGKSDAFLQKAFESGVNTFVAESMRQLERLENLASKFAVKPNVLLRLQLQWEGQEASVLGGSKTTVFGLDSSSWGTLYFPHLNICGVHVFQWGNIQSPSRMGNIWKKIAIEAKAFAREKHFELNILDLGGGLGIPYDHNGLAFDWQELTSFFSDTKEISGAGELWLELGRYASGSFGFYVTKILESKRVNGKRFLICEGGAQHIVRPALVKESFPLSWQVESTALIETHVHGPLCTALDHLGTYDLPEELGEGDLLFFSQCGAYGFTESMPFFLCHEMAGEVILKNNEFKVLRSVTPASDWLR